MLYLHQFSLPIDISAEVGKSEGKVLVTHVIKGFEKDVFMIEDHEELVFFFMVKISEKLPLFVPLTDQAMYDECVDFVAENYGK